MLLANRSWMNLYIRMPEPNLAMHLYWVWQTKFCEVHLGNHSNKSLQMQFVSIGHKHQYILWGTVIDCLPRSDLSVSSSIFQIIIGLLPTVTSIYFSISTSSTVDALTAKNRSACFADSPGVTIDAPLLFDRYPMIPSIAPFLFSLRLPIVSPSVESKTDLNLHNNPYMISEPRQRL